MSHQTGQLANSAPPVFILSSALPDKVTIADICETVENEVGFGSVFGCQYIEGTGFGVLVPPMSLIELSLLAWSSPLGDAHSSYTAKILRSY